MTAEHRWEVLAAVLDLSDPDIFRSSGSLNADHIGTLQILDGSGQVLGSTSTEQVLTIETIDKILAHLYVDGKPSSRNGPDVSRR